MSLLYHVFSMWTSSHIPDLTDARETVKHGYYDEVEMLYEDVPDTLSQLIRTAFVPRPGYQRKYQRGERCSK